MKLNHIIPQCFRNRLVRRFGKAKIIRKSDGRHELIGGDDIERAAAFEWASLFAHEIVFMNGRRKESTRRFSQKTRLASQFQPAL